MAFVTKEKVIVDPKRIAEFVTGKKTSTPENIEDIKKSYHNQRLTQSQWAFWLSFWGNIVGFLVIMISLIFNNNEWPGIVAGGILEVVSILFYQLSNKANEKITEFFDKLTSDSNSTKAISLIEKIDDSSIKDELIVKISLHLVGINEDKLCNKVRSVCKTDEEH